MNEKYTRNIHNILKNTFDTNSFDGRDGSAIIIEDLSNDKPSMIARFGSTEIKAILFPYFPWPVSSLLGNRIQTRMEVLSGFYPSNSKTIKRFSKLMIEDMKELDILASWRIEERFLERFYPQTTKIALSDLEPYLQKNPWSQVLEGKKILVVHPFNTTIEQQYFKHRQDLFSDKRVLPEFKSLETIKAVQTIAGNKSEFADWFEALDYMKSEIDKKDFDIAIIGCGAYGFPLAAHVKRMGKKAIHLGGPTQMLFGIKGKRWLESEKFQPIINEYFVFPAHEDIPQNADKVEGGCYW